MSDKAMKCPWCAGEELEMEVCDLPISKLIRYTCRECWQRWAEAGEVKVIRENLP